MSGPVDDPAVREAVREWLRRYLTESARLQSWEQDCRARWRALALVIKAKLAAIEVGITSFEAEFGMAVVLPDGRTVAEQVVPAIAEAYESGRTPRLLELGS